MRSVCTFVILTIALGLVAACSSAKPGGTSAPSRTSAASTSAPAGSAPAPSDALGRVQAWYGAVKPDLDAVQTQTQAITTAAGTRDVPALNQACGSLRAAVAKFVSDPVAPDKLLNAALTQTMRYYAIAATDCIEGDFSKTADALAQGTRYFQQANFRLTNLD